MLASALHNIVDAVVIMKFTSDAYEEIEGIEIVPLELECKARRILCDHIQDSDVLFVIAFSKSQVLQLRGCDKVGLRKVFYVPRECAPNEKVYAVLQKEGAGLTP